MNSQNNKNLAYHSIENNISTEDVGIPVKEEKSTSKDIEYGVPLIGPSIPLHTSIGFGSVICKNSESVASSTDSLSLPDRNSEAKNAIIRML
mmetsp:Transcript_8785/g.7769  ORF Transcript_8785/g.7769 Transcript_8785/m.7769 type:complete len:92 (+) Transcript_8785:50-325(+)